MTQGAHHAVQRGGRAVGGPGRGDDPIALEVLEQRVVADHLLDVRLAAPGLQSLAAGHRQLLKVWYARVPRGPRASRY